jgi:hypothetical protein
MNEGTRSGKSTIRFLGISAERPTNGLYLLPFNPNNTIEEEIKERQETKPSMQNKKCFKTNYYQRNLN